MIAGLVSLLFHSLFLGQFAGIYQLAHVPTIQSGIQATLVVAATKPLEPSAPQPSLASAAPLSPSLVEATRKPSVFPGSIPSPVKSSEINPPKVTAANTVSRISAEQVKQDQAPGLPKAGDRQPALQVDIEFEIFLGMDRKSAGVGRHLYVSDGVQHYGLSVSETVQKESVGQPEPWQLDISGDLVPQGLSPSLFQSKGALPERLMALKSVPDEMARPIARNGRMPDGILDRQSLLYQFMHHPPAEGGGKILLSDGSGHGEYSYRIVGRETLRIPALGDVSTMKLLLTSGDSTEVLELWLIPESHYLPAKVRHVDEHGVVTEQLVVSLSFK